MQITVKVADLTGDALDHWVSHVIGSFLTTNLQLQALDRRTHDLAISQQWEAAGYLMEKFNIGLTPPSATQPLWTASEAISGAIQRSEDAKLAVLRCLVASRMGEIFTAEKHDRGVPVVDYDRNKNLAPMPPLARAQSPGNASCVPPENTASALPGNLPAVTGDLPDSWI